MKRANQILTHKVTTNNQPSVFVPLPTWQYWQAGLRETN